MEPNNTVELWSRPIISGRSISNYLKNGMGTLLVVNVSKRSIVFNYEFYDKYGSTGSSGYNTVNPGHIDVHNCMNGRDKSREYMYCKLWFDGFRREIRASLIMSTVAGPPGEEIYTPVYSVALE